jgi:hypothetical protein
MRARGGGVRPIVLTLVGWLSVSSCAAQPEPKCAERAAPSEAKAPSASDDGPPDLIRTLLDGIPRPTPGQFDTPERALGFLIEKIASRDIAGSLAVFPVVEHAERVTLKDYAEYTGVVAPGMYPLDDDPHARFTHALANYLGAYRQVALRILTDDTGTRVVPPGSDPTAFLRELDGSRLKALKVLSMTELRPESRPPITPIDRAIGVTEKRAFSATVALDQRTVEVTAFVGRVASDWRVLFVFAEPLRSSPIP